MPDLDRLLHDAIGDIAEVDVSSQVERRVHRRRNCRHGVVVGVATVALAAAAVAGGAIVTSDDDQSVRVAGQDELPSGDPVFSTPTGVVLLLDDGYDGVAALDLDSGVVGRRVVVGQRAGDQPFRLFRVDDSLIVGWEEVYAAPLSGAPSVSLGEATIAIPAVEADSVWLATWSDGRIGLGDLSLRLVDMEGRTLVEGPGPAVGGYPGLGVPGGVAIETPTGQLLWDVEAQTPIATFESGRVLAATTDRVMWCEASCSSLLVRDLATSEDTRIGLPVGVTALDPDPANAAISPDGSRLAIFGLVQMDEGSASDAEGHVLVFDLDAATVDRATSERVPMPTAPRWSPDGRFVLWTTIRSVVSVTEVGRYDVRQATVESRQLPLRGSLRAVPVERTAGRSFLPSIFGQPEDCPPPAIQPSGRTGLCGFRVTYGQPVSVGVPDVQGLILDHARRRMEEAGLRLSVIDGDPELNEAIVVAQEPLRDLLAPLRSAVGVRTAVVNEGICSGLEALPERDGDALQLAQEPGFSDAIQAAASAASEQLRTDIARVLAVLRSGGDLADSDVEVGRSLDRIAIHRDACALG